MHTDFYSAYGEIDCKKQKCLVHLLRELRDTALKDPIPAKGALCRRLKQKGQLAKALYQQRGGRLEERLRELAGGAYRGRRRPSKTSRTRRRPIRHNPAAGW